MNEVYLVYTNYTEELPDRVFAEYLSRLPKALQNSNRRYLRWEDRTSNLLGKTLLMSIVKSLQLDLDLQDLNYNAYNKPFFNDLDDFSISHSGNYVICAFGLRQKIGVDIEEIKEIQMNDFRQVFTPEQFETIEQSNDPTNEFYKFWTIKESVVKADGRGLSLPLHDIKIVNNKANLAGTEWFLHAINIADNYSVSLATEHEHVILFKRKFDLEHLDQQQ